MNMIGKHFVAARFVQSSSRRARTEPTTGLQFPDAIINRQRRRTRTPRSISDEQRSAAMYFVASTQMFCRPNSAREQILRFLPSTLISTFRRPRCHPQHHFASATVTRMANHLFSVLVSAHLERKTFAPGNLCPDNAPALAGGQFKQ